MGSDSLVDHPYQSNNQKAIYARNLIEASLDPLFIVDTQGKLTDVNNATERATGLAREQLIGSDFSAYFTDTVRAKECYQRVFMRERLSIPI